MTTQRGSTRQPARKSGHLTVRPEGEGADVRALFDSQDTQISKTRVFSGVIVHVVAIALLLLIAQLIPDSVYDAVIPDRLSPDMVFLALPGPGGGGGGGNQRPEP